MAGWATQVDVGKMGYLEDGGEFRVAQVGDDLGGGFGHSGGQPEGLDGPVQVALPALLLQGQPLTQGRLVHLYICPFRCLCWGFGPALPCGGKESAKIGHINGKQTGPG